MAPSNRRIICQGRGIEHAKYKNYDEHLLNYGHKGKDFNRQYQNIAFFSSTLSCLETIFYTILESDANAEDILNSVAARCKKHKQVSHDTAHAMRPLVAIREASHAYCLCQHKRCLSVEKPHNFSCTPTLRVNSRVFLKARDSEQNTSCEPK